MIMLDNQIYFVVWTDKDTGHHWNLLVHGHENAVAEAESLIKSGNVNAVWVTVAINVYKPRQAGVEKSEIQTIKNLTEREVSDIIRDCQALFDKQLYNEFSGTIFVGGYFTNEGVDANAVGLERQAQWKASQNKVQDIEDENNMLQEIQDKWEAESNNPKTLQAKYKRLAEDKRKK